MDPKFLYYTDRLPDKYLSLIQMAPVRLIDFNRSPLPNVPTSGVYLFSEKGQHLYAGRSQNLSSRVRTHARPSSRDNAASFSYLLAGGGDNGITRAQRLKQPGFADAFKKSKYRIRNMDLRYIIETDAIGQCLLEVYVALVLDTSYNDFSTH